MPLLGASWESPLDWVANIVTAARAGARRLRPSPRRAASSLPVAAARAQHSCGASCGSPRNAVEVLCKSMLDRPLLHAPHQRLYAFQSSWPSGHTLRTVLVAAIVAFVWHSAARWVVDWAAASLVLLEIDGFHVPTDIAGGLLLALLAADLARRAARAS